MITSMITPRQANALFVAGELAGVASRLDTEALQQVIDHPQPDFRYAYLCKAAIEFTNKTRGILPA